MQAVVSLSACVPPTTVEAPSTAVQQEFYVCWSRSATPDKE